MLKKMLFAAALTGLLAGAALPLQSATAEAGSSCYKASKAKYHGDRKARVAYRKECRMHHKAQKASHRKGLGLFKKKSA